MPDKEDTPNPLQDWSFNFQAQSAILMSNMQEFAEFTQKVMKRWQDHYDHSLKISQMSIDELNLSDVLQWVQNTKFLMDVFDKMGSAIRALETQP